ncbi:MAG: helix-turn-helix domain-containing protein [Cytophagales bacterium]|nr:helix-turn-helix domain-containing protein [Cytophagales bacterium]
MVKRLYYKGEAVHKTTRALSNLLSITQVCEATGLSRKTIHNYATEGILQKHYYPNSTRVYFLSEEVEEAIPGCKIYSIVSNNEEDKAA